MYHDCNLTKTATLVYNKKMIYHLNLIDTRPTGFEVIIELFISTKYFISDVLLKLANIIHTMLTHFNIDRIRIIMKGTNINVTG